MKSVRNVLLAIIVAFIFSFSSRIYAIDCSVLFTPSSMGKNSQKTITFALQNTSEDQTAAYFRFMPTQSLATFISASGDGWNTNVSSGEVVATEGSVAPGQTTSIAIVIASGDTTGTEEFDIQISQNSDGSDAGACIGGQGLTVTDSTGVYLSDLSITSLTDTSTTISFSTNVAATSSLQYGLSSSYGTTQSISTATTTHSYTITGLSKNLTYHFVINATNTDSSDTSGDQTFTTSVNTSISTSSSTSTSSSDTQAPTVVLNPLTIKNSLSVPVLSGVATDGVGVETLEYTTNNGASWHSISFTKGTSVSYSFTPVVGDGTTTIKVRAKDAAGNSATSSAVSFSVDRTGPTITLSTSLKSVYKTAPTIEGTAKDASGIKTVEYSFDGTNWQAVSAEEISGNTDTFKISPGEIDDGNYSLEVRATDGVGNKSNTKKTPFIIDRLPPRLGGTLHLLGTQLLYPDENDTILTLPGASQRLFVSLVGGVTDARIEFTQNEKKETRVLKLTKKENSYLWGGTYALYDSGTYTVMLFAIDGAGNKLQKKLSSIQMVPEGSIRNAAGEGLQGTVSLFRFDATENKYVLWNGELFGQNNPKQLGAGGAFSFLAPAGEYYVRISPDGQYSSGITSIISLPETLPIAPQIVVQKQLSIGPFVVPFSSRQLFPLGEYPVQAKKTLQFTGRKPPEVSLPYAEGTFSFDSLTGKPAVVMLLNSWAPETSSQLAMLEDLKTANPTIATVVIFPHETASSVSLLKKRGSYHTTFVADPDGTILETMEYPTIPTYYLFNKKGFISKRLGGNISLEELQKEEEAGI